MEKDSGRNPYTPISVSTTTPTDEKFALDVVTATVDIESTKPAVQVTAPSDLQEGYQLNVRVDGRNALITVPHGGVRKGDTFVGPVQFLDDDDNNNKAEEEEGAEREGDGIPVGSWRHGICDCCVYGLCHPLWIMSCYGPSLALAQVQTRLNLNICGAERHSAATPHYGPSAFRMGMILFVVFKVGVLGLPALYHVLAPNVTKMTASSQFSYDENSHTYKAMLSVFNLISVFGLLVVLFLVGASLKYRCFLEKPSSFRILLGVFFFATVCVDIIVYVIYSVAALGDASHKQSPNIQYVDVPTSARFVAILHLILVYGMLIFILYAGTKTRTLIRKKYAIPQGCCGDCCCMFWCLCCSIAQMSSHTADYRKQPMDYGAENGLKENNQFSYADRVFE